MPIYSNQEMINQTRKWVQEVVIGTNFCPFAAKEMKANTIHYEVAPAGNMAASTMSLQLECERLNEHSEIETTLLLFPFMFSRFSQYLEFVEVAEIMLHKQGYDGIYQLASFHPNYCFAGSSEKDAANYTNRSIYPMLHLIREASIEKAIEKYPNPEGIPERNILYAKKKGLAYMKLLKDKCLE
ncbi:MAG: hypothetical protein CFE21_12895 [Bacteroidetes bacterium B1(2017)]|nr:MAG: hypothetical protein CFE21_12895 [Bacteroidetes bacterium B1(2017)]